MTRMTLSTQEPPEPGPEVHPDEQVGDTEAWERLPPISDSPILRSPVITSLSSDGANLVEWTEEVRHSLATLQIDQVLRCDIQSPKHSHPAYEKWRYWSGVAARWITDSLEPVACMRILHDLSERGLNSLDWAIRADELILDIQRWANTERGRVGAETESMRQAQTAEVGFLTGTGYLEKMQKEMHVVNRQMRYYSTLVDPSDTKEEDGDEIEAEATTSNAELTLPAKTRSPHSRGVSQRCLRGSLDEEHLPDSGCVKDNQATNLPKIQGPETLMLQTIEILDQKDKNVDEWVSSVRHSLSFHDLEALIDGLVPRPERNDKNYRTWKFYSVLVGDWLMKHLSAAFRDRVKANIKKAPAPGRSALSQIPVWYADNVMNEIFAITEEGKSNSPSFDVIRFWCLYREDFDNAVDYIHAVQEQSNILAWQGIAPPPYFILTILIDEIEGEVPNAGLLQWKIAQENPTDITVGLFNEICNTLRVSAADTEGNEVFNKSLEASRVIIEKYSSERKRKRSEEAQETEGLQQRKKCADASEE